MSKDIVETLIERAAYVTDSDDGEVFVSAEILTEAAREIEHLRGRIARLEGLA